jgi:hypothetical protein
MLLTFATSLVSCASQREKVALVDDPDAKHESQIPWNKQEKWESAGLGPMSNVSDRR